MSASDHIKEALVNHFAAQGVATTASQWKRRSKTTISDYVARGFDNAAAGLSVLAVTVDEDDDDIEGVCIWEEGPIGFGIGQEDGRTFLSFTPMTHWDRTHRLPSIDDYAHYERGISALPLRYCGDDCGDNRFAIQPERVDAIRADLVTAGYTEIDLAAART